jgi:hemolysin activation/secretion protein
LLRNWLLGLAGIALCPIVLGTGARAQPVPAIVDPNQQQQNYNDRQRELQRIAPPEGGVLLRKPVTNIPNGGNCVTVAHIRLEGADHLSESDISATLAGFAGKCMTLADINRAIDAVNAAYIARGYVTSRGYLPPQDLSKGTLRIVAVEGTVSGIEFKGQPDDHHALGAFPGVTGEVLNLRDIEQGLEQMNRLPSWDAKMHVAPGAKTGTSVIIVDAPANGIFHGSAWLDNNDPDPTGRLTGHVLASADDPLGLLDQWGVEYDHSLLPHNNARQSSYANANFSLPFGYWTWTSAYSYSDYKEPVVGLTDTFKSSGHTQRWTFGLDRVLFRDQETKTTLSLGYELKQVDSYLDDVRLATQSEDLAAASVRLSHTRRIWGGAWYFTLGMQFGLPGMGTANTVPHPDAEGPHAQYVRPSLDIDGYQPVTLFGRELEWHPSLHAEYASATLYATQRLQLGGLYTVRGFLNNQVFGDHGAYWRNDLTWKLPPVDLGLWGLSSKNELYLALDAGWAEVNASAPQTARTQIRGVISGGGIGWRTASGPAFADVSVTHAIDTGPLAPEGWIVLFKSGVKF